MSIQKTFLTDRDQQLNECQNLISSVKSKNDVLQMYINAVDIDIKKFIQIQRKQLDIDIENLKQLLISLDKISRIGIQRNQVRQIRDQAFKEIDRFSVIIKQFINRSYSNDNNEIMLSSVISMNQSKMNQSNNINEIYEQEMPNTKNQKDLKTNKQGSEIEQYISDILQIGDIKKYTLEFEKDNILQEIELNVDKLNKSLLEHDFQEDQNQNNFKQEKKSNKKIIIIVTSVITFFLIILIIILATNKTK